MDQETCNLEKPIENMDTSLSNKTLLQNAEIISEKFIEKMDINLSDLTMRQGENSNLEESAQDTQKMIIVTPEASNSVDKSRKRGIQDELSPALIRIPSENTDCCPDFIRIDKDNFKIGRRPENDLVILSPLVSRYHCALQCNKNSCEWYAVNYSSTDTLINESQIECGKRSIIKEGDILQLSLSERFKFRFTFVKRDFELGKHPKLEINMDEVNLYEEKQRTIMESQENERKGLEKQLSDKQQEQEQLKQELEKLLKDQNDTKTCNQKLNNEISKLQSKIEAGSAKENELQKRYTDLLKELELERIKFEDRLVEEKERWQKELKEKILEKEMLEVSIKDKMEEFKEKLKQTEQKEWEKKMDDLLLEKKSIQMKLQNEKELLEQKLQELEEKERIRQQEQNDLTKSLNIPKRIIVERNSRKCLPIIETIDLTASNTDEHTQKKSIKTEGIIDKVNNIMDEQLTCSICSELFIRAMTLNCMHTFCRHCIEMWVKKRRECPNCRTTVISMTRSLVVDNFIDKMLESLTPEEMQRRKQLIEQRTVVLKRKSISRPAKRK